MKKIIIGLILAVAIYSATYFTKVFDGTRPERYESLMLETDVAATSEAFNFRPFSRVTIFVQGLNTTSVVIGVNCGAGNFAYPDTITSNGVYDFSDYMGSSITVSTLGSDAGVKVYGIFSTY